jgi:hypothetical protein
MYPYISRYAAQFPVFSVTFPISLSGFNLITKLQKKARKKRNKRRRIKKQGKECKKAKARIALIFNKQKVNLGQKATKSYIFFLRMFW